MNQRRWWTMRLLVAAAAWGTAGVLAAAPLTSTPAAADNRTSNSSAVTASGTGAFSSLKVTVSQTTGLIDQDIRVSWTGGKQSQVNFKADYLQLMQCWGDDPSGPTRKQCEFGNSGDSRGGDQVTTRQLDAGASFADPAEKQVATDDNPYNYVPFESATWVDDPDHPGQQKHPEVLGDHAALGQYFDAQTTNEQPFGMTGADGDGETFFETVTAQEAPGLGCGSTTTLTAGGTFSPACYLVIVPRDETEVNGQPYTANGSGLVSTPLSESNWDNRIVVPLQFAPIGLQCPIGSAEQHTSGQETAAEAVFRWQAALCQQSGTVYSYAKTSDDAARRQVLSHSPGLDFVSDPVPASTNGASNVVYAPLALSGAVIAFDIDYSSVGSNALRTLAGQRVPDINLTPRLVAKLITQSYQLAAPLGDPPLTYDANPHNVLGLTYDPDFAAANPRLAGLNNGGGDLLMPFTPSDATRQLWAWLDADPDARAFLDGQPDPWGMTVNPNYLRVTDAGAPNSFPKQDPYCETMGIDNTGSQPPPLCTLDARPYAADLHDAARAASRGDTLSRSQWDPNPPQPHYKKVPPQISGKFSVMAFTDAATAARYSLPVAHLRNAAGAYVAPDAAGLRAGLDAMKPSGVPGVVSPDPATTNAAAYPLTTLTYAATNPSQLTAAARSNYADFLQYAVTSGQHTGVDIGDLPVGYVPLPQALTTEALTVSVALRSYVAPTSTAPTSAPPTVSPKPKPKPTTKHPSPSKSPAPRTTAPATLPRTPPPPVVRPPVVPTLPTPTPTPASSSVPAVVTTAAPTVATKGSSATPAAVMTVPTHSVAEVRRTAAVSAGGSRYLAVLVLAVGGISALAGPALLRFGRRRS